MASKINICNQALVLLGENIIQSLTEDTVEAKTCAVFYDDALKSCIEDIKPNFAIKRSGELTRIGDAESFGFEHVFALPQDCLKALSIAHDVPVGYSRQWRVEGRQFLAREKTVKIRYLAPVNEVLFPGQFAKALAAHLAVELAYPLTNSDTKVAQMAALYAQRKDDLMAADGMESSTQETQNTQLSEVR